MALSLVGFWDNNRSPRGVVDAWRMKASELELYVSNVEKARRDYPGLKIKLALEVDYLPGYEAWVRDLAGRYQWDYLIGSVHYISDSWAIDNPKQLSQWKTRDPLEVWTAYFERLTLAAESKLFDIIGHTDLCKKFCIYPQQDCSHLFARFLETARRNDVAIDAELFAEISMADDVKELRLR